MGNTCSDGRSPGKFSLKDLKTLGVGNTLEMNTGCGPDIIDGDFLSTMKNRGFGWPENGEFDSGGKGNNCSMCSDPVSGYGCDNCSGTIGGRRATVKRNAFKGDPTKCCSTPSSKWWEGPALFESDITNADRTCDPASKDYTKDYCDQWMQTYCASINNTGSALCAKWTQDSANKGRSTATQIMSNYCSQGTNYKTSTCQDWVQATKAQPSLKFAGDNALVAYCQNNSTDPKCACQNPPQNVTALQQILTTPKVCWYEPCKTQTSQQYLTSRDTDILHGSACAGVTCQINAGDIDISQSQTTKATIENKCGTQLDTTGLNGGIPATPTTPTPTTPTTPITPSTPTTPIPSTPSPATAESKNKMLLLGGGGILLASLLLCCCIAIIIIIIMATQKQEE